MATITKTKRRDAVGGETTKPPKSPSDDDRSGGDSPRRTLQKQQRRPSQASAVQKGKRGAPAKRASPSGKQRCEKRDKQRDALTMESVGNNSPRETRSKSSSPERAHHSPQRKTPELPPYIRATIAEQLAPARSRPAREDTKDNLFGQDQTEKKKPSNARSRENTQKTLFGSPEPIGVRKSSRTLADTKNNLFGPPPEVPIRPQSRQRPDTPDILSHERHPPSDVREVQLNAIVGRYVLRHQDTHQKLFGAPENLRKPPPPKPTSSIFYHDVETCQDTAVKSLPLGSLIVVTREVQPPGSPLEVSQN